MSSAHIPFIKLTFGNESFTWSGSESRPDYFTSLLHKRYSEEANTMTINLTYCPKIGENPNRLEDAIVAAGGQCQVQYGDFSLGEKTPLYKGLVCSYKTNHEGGVLVYNLSLISSMVCYTYEQYPGCEFKTQEGHTIAVVKEEIKNIVENYMSFSGNSFRSYIFDEESSVNFSDKVTFSTISVSEGNPISALKSIVRQLKVKKLWRSEEQEVDQSLRNFIVNPVNRESTGSRAAVVVQPGDLGIGGGSRKPEWKDPYEGVDHSLNHYLSLEVDESGTGPGKVRIVLVNSDVVSATYTFEWGDKNSEVLSWSPEYDGIYSIMSATGGKKFSTFVSTAENGEFGYTTYSFNAPAVRENGTASDLFAQVENLEINQNEIDRHYEYKAVLTVLGKSKMLDIGVSVIKVLPIVAGSYHHTAGDYVVIGIEDSVSSEGFTTTYTLYKRKSYDLYGTGSKGIQVYHNGSYIPFDEYDPSDPKYSTNPNPINPHGSDSNPGGSSDLGGSTSGYSNSSLAKSYMYTKNYSKGRVNVTRISIHHMAGAMTAAACGRFFGNTNRVASSNYGIGWDGSIGLYVSEANRSWATSSKHNDNRAITIEVSNEQKAGYHNNWKVSDASIKSLIKLCADICIRNGINKFVYDPKDSKRKSADMKGNLTIHQWFAPTTCPGGYLKSKFPYITEEVNKIIDQHMKSLGEFVSVESRSLTRAEQEINVRYIYNYLKPRGWSLNAIAGMIGNFQAESAINPARWQSDKIGATKSGYGLAQWTPASKFLNWCNNNGFDPTSMDSALKRIEDEMNDGYQYYSTSAYPLSFRKFKVSTESASYLACAFAWNYERSKVVISGSEAAKQKLKDQRGGFATTWYNYLKDLYGG